jgi:O-6-methylguanine DNA methyltransferase
MKTGRTRSLAVSTIPELRRPTMNRKKLALARQRLGLRWPSTAFATPHAFKAPATVAPERRYGAPRRRKGWRSPKPDGNWVGSKNAIPIATPWGKFIARYSEKGLAELSFPVGRASSFHCGRRGNEALSFQSEKTRDSSRRLLQTKMLRWHRTTTAALKAVLAGREPEKFPPLDLAGTAFQKRVWNTLRKIPVGKTKSYGEVAQAIGEPNAARAVGGACGANPIPVLVPCHRVLAANQKLGGFSGGLDWKRKLLAREGVVL